MNTNAKAFVTVGGAAYLGSRFVFNHSNKKALMIGVLAGVAMLALLQIKPNALAQAKGQTSPELPETDNTRGNLFPETLPPIRFDNGKPLQDSVLSTLENI